MAYTNRTIRLAFDGTDDNYPLLGDDIWVVVRNPMLVPMSKLQTDIELDESGRPRDPIAATRASLGIIAGLIVDWNVYSTDDLSSDDPEPVALPATTEKMENLPMPIAQALVELVGKALDRK